MVAENITLSRPAGAALLRKLVQPLFDTNVFPNAVATQLLQYFRIPIGGVMPIAAAPRKSLADTNMSQAGQLGTPQMFDLFGFNFEYHIHDMTDVADVTTDLTAMYQQSVFTWFFGTNRPWLRLPLSQITKGVSPTGEFATGDITGNSQFIAVHQGPASVEEWYNFTVGQSPIRINTAEPFSAEITWPNGAVTPVAADTRVRVLLKGNLYAAL